MLGLCWAILGLCWAFVGSFGVLLAAFGPKKIPPTEISSVGFFFWVGFGLMLAHLEAMLGLCWAILRLCWTLLGLSGLKIQPQPTHGSVGVEFWAGFGLMLGHLLSRSRAMKRVRLSVLSGKYGKIWFYKLSFFWTHVGHLLCHFIFRFSTYPRHAGFNLLYLDFSFSERGVGTAFHLFTFFLLIP